MTSINRVIMVGNIISKPEVLETSGKKKYVKFKLETWNHRRINGDVKKLTAQHTVLCFNQMALDFLEKATPGTRIHLTGELDYDRQGNPQVVVPQYVGDIGAMDVDVETATEAASQPEAAKPTTPPASRPFMKTGFGGSFSRPVASSPAAPVAAKAGGGLGRLPLKKSAEPQETSEDHSAPAAENSVKLKTPENKNKFLESDGFDSEIPF